MSLFGDLLALLRGSRDTGAIRAATPDVQLPFNPPLGTPIRYAYESSRQRRGMVQTTRALEEMTLFAAQDGYRLQWVTREAVHAASGAGAEHIGPLLAAMNRLAASTIDRPLLFDLDADGSVLGLANMADWRATQAQIMAGLVGSLGDCFAGLPEPQLAQLRGLLAAMAQDSAAQSDEQFLGDMSETLLMALHGGIALPDGKEIAFDLETPARMGDLLVNQRVRVQLDRNAARTWARVHMTSTVDPADTALLARQRAEAWLEASGLADVAGAAQPFPETIDLMERTMQLIALPSGLVQRASWQRAVAADGKKHRLEQRSIRRLQ
jgi:hypothetical protein